MSMCLKCTSQSKQGPPALQSACIRNPPLRACKVASGTRSLKCAGPRTASDWSPKLPRDALCAFSHADLESDDEHGD
eukprot:15436073-Alexandrium_andersonii.AAC.1